MVAEFLFLFLSCVDVFSVFLGVLDDVVFNAVEILFNDAVACCVMQIVNARVGGWGHFRFNAKCSKNGVSENVEKTRGPQRCFLIYIYIYIHTRFAHGTLRCL